MSLDRLSLVWIATWNFFVFNFLAIIFACCLPLFVSLEFLNPVNL